MDRTNDLTRGRFLTNRVGDKQSTFLREGVSSCRRKMPESNAGRNNVRTVMSAIDLPVVTVTNETGAMAAA